MSTRTNQTRADRNRKIGKGKYIFQILLLLLATGSLIALSLFYFLSKDVDISNLEDGLAQSTIIYDVNGKVASKITANKTEGVPFNRIPEHLKNAIVAIEDHRFYEHDGVDYKGLIRAFYKNLKAGGVVEGGSTITQQLTKNALLSHEKTYRRKLEEFFLAKEIEKNYTKEKILEMYLNQIYFGEGAWGVRNAALKYFGKEASELTIEESALLAGLVKAPTNLNPYNHIEKAKERRNLVLNQMYTHGFITKSELDKATKKKVKLTDSGIDPLKGKYPHYIDVVLNEGINKYGFTLDELLTGGYEIHTELDPHMQTVIEETYTNDQFFPADGKKQMVQSGAILLDPKTGGIRALIGGRGETVFMGYNRATQLKAQPGSSMKPIAAYAPALENGWSVTDSLVDEKISFGSYSPSNYNHQYKGRVPMYEAVKDSLNLPAVWLLNEIGIEKGINAAEKFGIPLDKEDRNLSIALGGLNKGVSPLHMAQAYSAFANKGERHEAHTITKIIDSEGNVVAKWNDEKVQVITDKVADQMTALLLGVVEQGTGRAAQINGREVAGKTGSTQVPIEGINGVKDQWFVGYTPQLVGAVWVGYDNTDKDHYLTTTSSEGAAPIFRELMEKSLKDQESLSFGVPSVYSYLAKKKQDEMNRARELEEKMKKEKDQWEDRLKKEREKWEKKFKDRGKGRGKGKKKKRDD
ncbi:PBP1A family penicillin-binding protein [Bacillus sp. 31A1R]|uniref:PBP1A family penicillin-binding protein n=1 Tax=Robertmurraya mangrovi TaxID=3098077 RepID=A0ABU5ISN2_9BACI|nr:PBP1A family penicillin-binding protein [Bacillus sp. 31A1R]MDZ5470158.1 PBP1A family penicillin-binding protein [Bacillus sp. 31A1R]